VEGAIAAAAAECAIWCVTYRTTTFLLSGKTKSAKKPRWTKAQKLANAEHKKRQAKGKPKNPSSICRHLHVV
jgi:hypothetical protein